ncbi:CYTH domain-containing protein [Planococcus sp. ISL-109]|uniref:CYTH domain-containing protein n=1 Tax=Planococcus sp. ISL-109 TaxID=2819166 RepID=UPI001BE89358|nr:CYTH domain-containing protein [Planococcus sp. ISL-109]MBT2581741.1 CYTH domain-containing protein [Planococcus sp. ISL-109]
MSKELEIEFKNMLTKEEYTKLLAETKKTPISQTNHYFDSADFQLRSQKAALRIRQTGGRFECTLKTPAPAGNYETTDNLTSGQAEDILKGNRFDAPEVRTELERMNVSPAELKLIGSLTTHRAEIDYAGGLLVLDHSEYCGIEDYEMEYEVTDETSGKSIFLNFLEEKSIPVRPADKKIARFMQAAQQC